MICVTLTTSQLETKVENEGSYAELTLYDPLGKHKIVLVMPHTKMQRLASDILTGVSRLNVEVAR